MARTPEELFFQQYLNKLSEEEYETFGPLFQNFRAEVRKDSEMKHFFKTLIGLMEPPDAESKRLLVETIKVVEKDQAREDKGKEINVEETAFVKLMRGVIAIEENHNPDSPAERSADKQSNDQAQK